jgi:DNA-directed RNA polymerase subunit M/transcription elongation factor TFIIS
MDKPGTTRTCPECASKEYVFRGRKKIAAEVDQAAAVETKYMCKSCGHEWKVRVPPTNRPEGGPPA